MSGKRQNTKTNMDLTICRICLTTNYELIEIFSAEGFRLDIKTIIDQHFWFQIEENDEGSKQICRDCWKQIETFHVFYKHIGDIHRSTSQTCSKFETLVIKSETNEDVVQLDTTLENPLVKSESDVSIKCQNSDNSDDNYSDDDQFTDEDKSSSSIKCKRKTTLSIKAKKKSTVSIRVRSKKSHRRSELATKEDNEKMRKYLSMSCDLCEVKFVTFADMKSHYRINHDTNGYLLCCEKQLITRGQIMGHIQWHIDPLKCEICGKTFGDPRTLKYHTDTHQPEKRIYQCDQCPKSFIKPYYLNSHRKHLHEKKVSFECKLCDKRFSYSNTLKHHMRSTHSSEEYVCEICAKIMKNKVNFDYHMKTQHSNSPTITQKLQCEICNKWLKTKNSFTRHMKNVHDESNQKYFCNECGRECPNSGALRNHKIYSHSLERTHKCDLCDKAFKMAKALKEHIATHTGQMLYTCPYCPRKCNSSATLYAHKKKKHPVEWEANKNQK